MTTRASEWKRPQKVEVTATDTARPTASSGNNGSVFQRLFSCGPLQPATETANRPSPSSLYSFESESTWSVDDRPSFDSVYEKEQLQQHAFTLVPSACTMKTASLSTEAPSAPEPGQSSTAEAATLLSPTTPSQHFSQPMQSLADMASPDSSTATTNDEIRKAHNPFSSPPQPTMRTSPDRLAIPTPAVTSHSSQGQSGVYTEEQVQARIQQVIQEHHRAVVARLHVEQTQELDEMSKRAEQILKEHGEQWQQDHKQEMLQLQNQHREEIEELKRQEVPEMWQQHAKKLEEQLLLQQQKHQQELSELVQERDDLVLKHKEEMGSLQAKLSRSKDDAPQPPQLEQMEEWQAQQETKRLLEREELRKQVQDSNQTIQSLELKLTEVQMRLEEEQAEHIRHMKDAKKDYLKQKRKYQKELKKLKTDMEGASQQQLNLSGSASICGRSFDSHESLALSVADDSPTAAKEMEKRLMGQISSIAARARMDIQQKDEEIAELKEALSGSSTEYPIVDLEDVEARITAEKVVPLQRQIDELKRALAAKVPPPPPPPLPVTASNVSPEPEADTRLPLEEECRLRDVRIQELEKEQTLAQERFENEISGLKQQMETRLEEQRLENEMEQSHDLQDLQSQVELYMEREQALLEQAKARENELLSQIEQLEKQKTAFENEAKERTEMATATFEELQEQLRILDDEFDKECAKKDAQFADLQQQKDILEEQYKKQLAELEAARASQTDSDDDKVVALNEEVKLKHQERDAKMQEIQSQYDNLKESHEKEISQLHAQMEQKLREQQAVMETRFTLQASESVEELTKMAESHSLERHSLETQLAAAKEQLDLECSARDKRIADLIEMQAEAEAKYQDDLKNFQVALEGRLEEQKLAVEEEVAKLKKESDGASGQMLDLSAERARMEERIEKLELLNAELGATVEKARFEQAELEEKYKMEIAQLNSQLEDRLAKEQELSELAAKLSAELDMARAEWKEQRQALETEHQERQQLEAETSTKTLQIYTDERDTLEKELAEVKEQLDQERRERAVLISELQQEKLEAAEKHALELAAAESEMEKRLEEEKCLVESRSEDEAQKVAEAHAHEKMELQDEIKVLKSRMEAETTEKDLEMKQLIEELKISEEAYQAKLVILQSQLESQNGQVAKLEEAAQDLEATRKKEQELQQQVEVLMTDLAKKSGEHDLRIAELVKEKETLIEELRAEIATLEADTDRRLQEQRLTLEAEQRNRQQERSEKAATELEALSKERDVLKERISELEERLNQDDASSRIRSAEEQVEEEKAKVLRIRDEHAKEMEELLAQLDLVEAEHNERYYKLEKTVQEKDSVLAALGAQLAEAQARMTAAMEVQETLSRESEKAQKDLLQANAEIQTLRATVEKAMDECRQAVEAERADKEKACELVREETIQRAEAQFKQANDMYVKLKQEYDASVEKASKLERDLKAAQWDVHKARQEQSTREIDLEAELAKARATLATADAKIAQKAKESRVELDAMKNKLKEFQMKAEEADANRRRTHKQLASVTAEKQQLAADNEEMKAVCEELMAMVEAHQGG